MSEVAGIDLATILVHLADWGGRASTMLCIFSGQLRTADPSNAKVSAHADHIVSMLQKLHDLRLKSDDLSAFLHEMWQRQGHWWMSATGSLKG